MALAVAQTAFVHPVSSPPSTATFGGSTTVGNRIIVIVSGYNGTPATTSVIDNKGNVYTRDFSYVPGALWVAHYSAPIVSGNSSKLLTATTGVATAIEPAGSAPTDFTIVAKIRKPTFGSIMAIASQAGASNTNVGWQFGFNTSGSLVYDYSTTGTSLNGSWGTLAASAYASVPTGAPLWVAFSYDNAGANYTYGGYWSADGVTWNGPSGGGTVSTPPALFDSAALLRIGGYTSTSLNRFGAGIDWVELRDGLTPTTGSVIWRFDANDWSSGTTWTDPRGLAWTLAASGAVAADGVAHAVTFTQAVDTVNIDMVEASGLEPSSPLDKTATNAATSASYTTGSTGTLSQANELVLVSVGLDTLDDGGGTLHITKDPTYTLISTAEFALALVSNAAYKIVSSTTAVNHAWTTTFASCPWIAGATTYKEAAGGPVTLSVNNASHGHNADAPTITTGFVVNPASHGHLADAPTLTVPFAVDNAVHNHLASAPTLATGILSDDFNRADASTLGSAWVTQGNHWSISSNKAIVTSAAGDFAVYNTALPSVDMFVQADLGNWDNDYIVVAARTSPATIGNTLYEGFIVPTAGGGGSTRTAKIGRDVAGSYADIASATIATPPDPSTVRLECQGSTLRLYINGALVITTTDTSITTGTYAGMNGFDLPITWDNWSAGSIASVVTLVVDPAVHGHNADAPTLSSGFVVNSAVHGHTADNILLPVTLSVASCTHGHIATQVTFALFLYPVAVSGRKFVDQNGDVFLVNDMSSWAMSQNLTNAQITQALQGVADRHFSSVNVAPCGVNIFPGSWHPYTNAAGQPFFAGAPFKTAFGAGWSSMDWVMSECTRLGLTCIISFFGSYDDGSTGIIPALDACTVAECRTYGQTLATRYINNLNIIWHWEAEGAWSATSPEGLRIDGIFHGIIDAYTTAGRTLPPLALAEQTHRGDPEQFINQELRHGFPGGYQYFLVSASSFYDYASNSTELFDGVYNLTTPTPPAVYPSWDCETPYVGAGHYSNIASAAPNGYEAQNLRERNYSVLIRGGIGLNFGDEAWWPFDSPGLFSPPWTWQQVMTNQWTFEAQYCWDLLCVKTFCKDLNWVPDNAFVTTGVGTSDSKAACGRGDHGLVAYFPSTRSVTIDTTVFPGTVPVRIRWFDPTTANYTSVAFGEAQQAGRIVPYPSGTHADGTTDWVLVVDDILSLSIDNATHGHVATSPVFTGTLSVDSATHGHLADNVTLAGILLAVASCVHGHTATTVTLNVTGAPHTFIGANPVSAVRVGTSVVSKLYVGTNQVWP